MKNSVIFLISAQNINCGYSLDPPRRGGSNEYPQSMFWAEIRVIFLISAQKINCGYSLDPPRRGGSNEYPQSMFWAEIRKITYTPVNPSFTI